jgi:hypothetical protein
MMKGIEMKRLVLTISVLVAILLPIWLIGSCGDTTPTGEGGLRPV